MRNRMLAIAMALTLLVPTVAVAQTGRRNTAVVTTAAAIYALARGDTGLGLLAAAGAFVAWDRYNDSRRGQRTRCRDSFMEGYRAGVQAAHRHGTRGRHR